MERIQEDNIQVEDDLPAATCSICKISDKNAEVFCFDCKETLCETCHTSHNAFKAMKDHNIFKMEHMNVSKQKGLRSLECWCRSHMVMKRFYCRTCDDAICGECILERSSCFDHQYVTLREISGEYLEQLKSLLRQCKFTKSRCLTAIQKTNKVMKEFTHAVENSKDSLSNIKNEHICMLDKVFEKLQESVKEIEDQRLKALGQRSQILRSDHDAVQRSVQLGFSVIKGTKFDIASNYVVMSNKLQEICDSKYTPADGTLKKINIGLPIVSFHGMHSWTLCGDINFGSDMNSGQILDIVSQPGEEICVICGTEILILSSTGHLKYIIRIPSNGGVLSLQDGNFILYRNGRLIHYQHDGKKLSSVVLCDAHRMPTFPHKPIMIIDFKGRVIVGSRAAIFNTRKPHISVHDPDGSNISTFFTSASPRYLAATSNEDIVMSLDNNTVQLVKYSGDNVRVIPKPPSVQHWVPREVSCSTEELFVVNEGQGVEIFSYTISGIYLGRVEVGLGLHGRVGFVMDGKKILVWEASRGMVQVFEKKEKEDIPK